MSVRLLALASLSLSLSLSDVDQTMTESYHTSEGEPLAHHEDMAGAASHESNESHRHLDGGVQFSNSFESEQTRVPGEGNGAIGDPYREHPGPTQQRKSSRDYSHTDEWGT